MNSRVGGSETMVVFSAQARCLAFKALTVRRTMASELWVGPPPLRLDDLLGVKRAAHETRTRVLELETSSDEAIPVLVRGQMSIRTLPRGQVRDVPPVQRGPRGLVEAIIDDGNVQLVVIAPDGVQEFVRRQSGHPATPGPTD